MRAALYKVLALLLCAAVFAPRAATQTLTLFTISAPLPAAAPAGSGALTVSLTVRQNIETTLLQQPGFCLYTGVPSTAVVRSASSTAASPSFAVPASDFDVPPASFSTGRYTAYLNVQVVGTACAATSTLSNSIAFPLSYPSLSSVSLAALPQPNAGIAYATYPTRLEINGAGLNAGTGANFTFSGQTATGVAFEAGTYLPSVGSVLVPVPTGDETGATGVGISVCNTSVHYRYCSPSTTLASFALASTSTQLTSSVASPVVGALTNLIATITPGAGSTSLGGPFVPGPPSGTVMFTDGSATLGSAALVGSALTFGAGSPQTINASSQLAARLAGASANRRSGTRPRPNDTPSPDNSTGFSSIVADFNLDGVPDALIEDTGSGKFHLLLGGSPTGNFLAEHVIASGCSSINGAAAADLNGDGYPDIAYLCTDDSNVTNIFVLYNQGDATFAQPVALLGATGAPILTGGYFIGTGDLNKDGKIDLVVTGPTSASATGAFGIQTFFGDGAGHFTVGPVTPTAADPGTQMVVTDLNHDGAVDLVLLNSSYLSQTTTVQTYQNNGSGSFTPAAAVPVCTCFSYTAKLFVAPLTGNTLYPDIVVAAPDQGQILVALNKGGAAIGFAPSIAQSVPNLTDAVLGDLNGDGFADLVTFDGTTIAVLNGDGAGNFSAQPTSPNFTSTGYPVANVSLVAATDLNQDGFADLLTIYPGATFTSTLQPYITTGTSVATLPATFTTAGTHALATTYAGNVDLLGSNGALALAVTQPAPAYRASLSITAPPGGTPGNSATQVYSPGGTFSLNFTVTQTTNPSQGVGYRTPGGTITVSENGKLLGSVAPVFSAPGASTASLNNFSSATTGVHTFSVVYSGDSNFSPVSTTYTYTITPALPVISWSTPATLNTNAPLDGTVLSATASVPGSFTYMPASGYLPAGSQTLSALFTPVDSVDYQAVTTTRTLNVLKVDPTSGSLQASPTTQTYLSGTPTVLTVTIAGLNVTPTGVVQFFDGTTLLGSPSLVATPSPATSAASVTLASLNAGSHAIRAVYAGDGVYNTSTSMLSYAVGAATPGLTYSPVPSTIAYGTTLVAGQLDALARTSAGAAIPGAFSYNHAVGDLLMAGSQTLTATFTPADSVSYKTATVSAIITVVQAAPAVTLAVASGGQSVTTVAAGSVITLIATVPATAGQVNFCDATAFCTDIHLLGTAQTTSTGTATFRFMPGIGTHTYRAVFLGSTDYAASSSGNVSLSVSGNFPTTTTLATSGTPTNYVLSATVVGSGNPTLTPTGAVSFLDASNANNPLATIPLGPGTTTQSFTTQPPSGVSGSILATADFNGDGIPDVIAGTSPTGTTNQVNQTLSVYLGNGDGTFTLKSTVNLPVEQAVTGDFNHDGFTDIALSSSAADTISILLGKGDGTFTLKSTNVVGGGIGTLVAADFNRDGFLDVVTGSTTSHTNPDTNTTTYTGTLTVLLGAGDGTFSAVQTPTPVAAASLASADFNGDGIPDLVAGDFFAQTATIFLGKGDGTFGLKSTNTIQDANTAAYFTTADFNGDGIADIAALDFYNSAVTILLGNGDGTFTQKPSFTDPTAVGEPNSFNIAIGDFNQDGIADLAVTSDDGVSIYLGAGDGTFTMSTRAVPQTLATEEQGHQDFGLLLGDFNGDGLLDLATTAPNFTVALNTFTSTAQATASNIALAGYGPHNLTANYAGDGNFSGSSSAPTSLTGQPVIPILTFAPTPTSLTFGTPLPVSVFDATASNSGGGAVAGVITYNRKPGDILSAGQQTLTATFTPADLLSYMAVSVSRTLTIARATPTLTWPVPAPITQGTSLSGTQLDATAMGYTGAVLFGQFAYTPGFDTTLPSGVQTLSVTFTPSDLIDYTTATATVPLTVNIPPARAVLTSSTNPTQYGQPTTLTVTVVPGGTLTTVPTGSVSFLDGAKLLGTSGLSPAGVATFPVGTLTAGPHTLTAAYLGDTANAGGNSAAIAQTVTQATPTITFAPNPATITYGTPITSAQLDATVTSTYIPTVPGAFTYAFSPTFTTLPGAGITTITATFTPTDTLDFTSATRVATVTVNKATPVITFPSAPTAIAGTPLASLQLNPTVMGVAGPNLPGTVTFTPNTGTVAVGPQTLNVTFTPADAADYTIATTTVTLNGTAVTLTALSSTTAQLGDPAKTITLTGTSFAPNSTARANGVVLTTTFVNSTSLTAVLPASSFLGVQTLQITVFNPTQSQTTAALPFTITPAPVGPVTFAGPSTANSGDQPTVRFALTNPYPVDLTATVTLTFAPISGGVDDPAIQFRNGSRVFSFNLAAGQTVSPTIQLQSGTVAGTIQITLALFIANGGPNVTPASVTPILITIPPAAPVVTSVTLIRSGRQLTVNVYGLSNTRTITQGVFHFSPASGRQIQTQDISLDVTSLFSGWYSQTVSATYGSTFLYTQTFALDDDATVVGQVTVTLSNGVGVSASGSAN